jgi:hypothetical protein
MTLGMGKRFKIIIFCLFFVVTWTMSSFVRASINSGSEFKQARPLAAKISRKSSRNPTKLRKPLLQTELKTKQNKASRKLQIGKQKGLQTVRTAKNKRLVKRTINKRKAKIFGIVAKRMKYASKCKEEFVSANGLGGWGRFVKDELSTGQYNELLKNDRAFKNVCPGFRSMDNEQRQNLWVFILMSMSHYESSCRPNVSTQGPYGRAKGLLQLHEGAENKYAHWDRDRLCQKGDSRNPKGSLQCTLSMLNGQVEKFDSIFFQGSYWDVLRNVNDPKTHASKIRLALQMIPDCRVRSVASNGAVAGKAPPKYVLRSNAKTSKQL